MNQTYDRKQLLKYLDRFLNSVVFPQLPKHQRLRSQWNYFHSLLSAEKIQPQRIQVYLNIIEKSLSKQIEQKQNKQNLRPPKIKNELAKQPKQLPSFNGSLFSMTKRVLNNFERGQGLIESIGADPTLSQIQRKKTSNRFLSIARQKI